MEFWVISGPMPSLPRVGLGIVPTATSPGNAFLDALSPRLWVGDPGEAGRRVPGDSSQMRLSEGTGALAPEGRLSLILPLAEGRWLTDGDIADYRRLLEELGTFESIEVIVA